MATPFHSTERCFRRYERIIAAVTAKYPGTVRFKCVARSAATDAARLLDAMNSFRSQHWTSNVVDRRKFVDSVYRNVDVAAVANEVIISPKVPTQVDVVDTSSSGHLAGRVERPEDSDILLAIAVIEKSIVHLPIELADLTAEQVELVMREVGDCFNVAIKQDGNTIILI